MNSLTKMRTPKALITESWKVNNKQSATGYTRECIEIEFKGTF